MPLCQATRKAPSFPKMLGLSSPRGHQMSLVDNGPQHADAAARYVLTVNETVTPFADEETAGKAWHTTFQACITGPHIKAAEPEPEYENCSM